MTRKGGNRDGGDRDGRSRDSQTAARGRRKRWRRLAAALLLLALAAAAGWVTKQARRRLSALPELRTVELQNRDLRITFGATGTVEPEEVIEVGALVAGKVVGFGQAAAEAARPVPIGARVSEGQVLAEVDRQLYEVAVRRARAAERLADAEIARLRTQLRQAARELQRAEQLRETNAQSVYDKAVTAHEMAQAELAIAEARLEQARSEVQQAEINLSRTAIRSPVDGVVIDRRVNLGQNVGREGPGLFLLARDLKQMRIRASVSETDIGKVQPGQPVSFTVDSQRERVHSGRVDRVLLNARMQGSFVTYDVLIAVDGPTDTLLPHMTADVEFETARREGAWLAPGESLQWWPAEEQLAGPPPQLPGRRGESSGPSGDDIGAADGPAREPAPREGDVAYLWVPADDGRVRPIRVRVGIDDGVQTEVIGDGLREQLPVVVGVIRKATLARIIPSVKTVR